MSTLYPGDIDTYTTKVDNVDDVMAAHVNNLQDAIVAIETAIGYTGLHNFQAGDSVLLYDSAGSAAVGYAATSAGLTTALAAAGAGDTVAMPSITIADAHTVAASAELCGMGYNSYLSGAITISGYVSDIRMPAPTINAGGIAEYYPTTYARRAGDSAVYIKAIEVNADGYRNILVLNNLNAGTGAASGFSIQNDSGIGFDMGVLSSGNNALPTYGVANATFWYGSAGSPAMNVINRGAATNFFVNAQANGTPTMVLSNSGALGTAGNTLLGTATDDGTNRLQVAGSGAITLTDAVATISDILTIDHEIAGAAAANFGAGIKYALKTSTTASQDAAQIATIWTDATHATRTSAATISLVNSAAALAEYYRFAPATLTMTHPTGPATFTASVAATTGIVTLTATGTTPGIYFANNIGITASPSTSYAINANYSVTNPGATRYGINAVLDVTATIGADANVHWGGMFQVNSRGTQNFTNQLRGVEGSVYNYSTGSVAIATGATFAVGVMGNGNITAGRGLRISTYGTGAGALVTATGLSIGNLGAYNTPTTMHCIDIDAQTTVVGTNKYGIRIGNISGATNNFSICTNAGNVVFNEGGDSTTIFRVEGDTDANLICTDAANDRVGVGTAAPAVKFHDLLTNATTNAVDIAAIIGHDTSGTAANGFGVGLKFQLESSTTAAQDAALLSVLWADATHATAVSDVVLSAYYNNAGTFTASEFLRGRGGANPLLSFYGGTPVVRGAALTAQLTTITHTAPGTPDYAIQDFVDVSLGAGWAFKDHDEANSVLKVVANLQARVAELEARLGSATGVNLFA